MMKQNILKRISICAALLLMLVGCLAFRAFAENVTSEGASVHASYRHPVTDKIEDSGGESSEALGQSMVESMVDPQGLLETDADGNLYLSVRFHLMSNVSKVDMAVQKPGDSEWTQASRESTAKGDDSEDFRVAVPSKDAVIRARCFVDAMGREVVFFVTADEFSAGNPGGFAVMKVGDKSASGASANGGSAIPENTVGVVTGGSNKASQQAVTVSTVPTAKQAPVRDVELSASVWIMLFVLVFCAQLLACLTFWGLKTLITKKFAQSSQQTELPAPAADASEEDFDMDFLDSKWEENV